jgi:pteridine reductase
MALSGKTILITGAARRIGCHLALTAARAGANVIIHHSSSPDEARRAAGEIERLGQKAWVLQADFRRPAEAETLIERAAALADLYALVNSAAIFEPLDLPGTSLADWQRHLDVNLTAPFLLSRGFAARLPPGEKGRIVNLLDWRALRPGADHLPYTISKAALAALTRSLAVALAPRIAVNGLALGAVLPPGDSADTSGILARVPAGRWAGLDEVGQALLFLLDGPDYVTGEILHLDGGRSLV